MPAGYRSSELIAVRPEDDAFAEAAWAGLAALRRVAASLLPPEPPVSFWGEATTPRVRIDSPRRRRPGIALVDGLGPTARPLALGEDSAHGRIARARIADPVHGTIAPALRPVRRIMDGIDARLSFDLVIHVGADEGALDVWVSSRNAMVRAPDDDPFVLAGADLLHRRAVDGRRTLARFHAIASRGALFHRARGRPHPWVIHAEADRTVRLTQEVRAGCFGDALSLGLRCATERLWLAEPQDRTVEVRGVGCAAAVSRIDAMFAQLRPVVLDPRPLLQPPAGERTGRSAQ